jgi:ribonuclease BN (tRNA processing enzyme)
VRFVPLGVGDAFSALHYGFCLAIEAEGQWLLVDCPHPIRKMMREGSAGAGVALDVGSFAALVLTHLHADHSSGVEGFGYFAHFALGRRAKLVAHPDVVARLWDGHLAAGMEQLMRASDRVVVKKTFEDYFDWTRMAEDAPVTVGPFTIECRRTIHHIPTTALRIAAGGRRLGVSADTAFDRGLIDWLAEADLVIHETNFGVHTPYADLAALPAELRAKMRLIHYWDEFDKAGSVIEPLEQGRGYEV